MWAPPRRRRQRHAAGRFAATLAPKNYRDYSDTRPDLTIEGAGAGGGGCGAAAAEGVVEEGAGAAAVFGSMAAGAPPPALLPPVVLPGGANGSIIRRTLATPQADFTTMVS